MVLVLLLIPIVAVVLCHRIGKGEWNGNWRRETIWRSWIDKDNKSKFGIPKRHTDKDRRKITLFTRTDLDRYFATKKKKKLCSYTIINSVTYLYERYCLFFSTRKDKMRFLFSSCFWWKFFL